MHIVKSGLGIMALIAGLLLSAGILYAEDDDADAVTSWSVESSVVTELDTGTRGNLVLLSPDGERLAHIARRTLCLYTIDLQPEACVELDERSMPDIGTMRWSPDGRYIAFSEETYIRLVDSSIWLVDTLEADVFAVTEPSFARLPVGTEETWPPIDLYPVWGPDDDTLYFIRWPASDDPPTAPLWLYRFDGLDSDPVEVAQLHEFGFATTTALDIVDDFVLFNVIFYSDPQQLGLWAWTPDADSPEQVFPDSDDRSFSLSVSPDRDQVLVLGERFINATGENPLESPARLINLKSGESRLIDPERFVRHGGWSPDGSAFAYIVFSRRGEEGNGLYITSEAGVPGELILPGDFYVAIAWGIHGLMWTENDTLLIGDMAENTARIIRLARQ